MRPRAEGYCAGFGAASQAGWGRCFSRAASAASLRSAPGSATSAVWRRAAALAKGSAVIRFTPRQSIRAFQSAASWSHGDAMSARHLSRRRVVRRERRQPPFQARQVGGVDRGPGTAGRADVYIPRGQQRLGVGGVPRRDQPVQGLEAVPHRGVRGVVGTGPDVQFRGEISTHARVARRALVKRGPEGGRVGVVEVQRGAADGRELGREGSNRARRAAKAAASGSGPDSKLPVSLRAPQTRN